MTPNKFKNAKKSHLAQKSYGSTFCDMSHHTKTGKHENHIFHSNDVLVESGTAVGLCCTQSAPVRCLSERKIVICDAFVGVYVS